MLRSGREIRILAGIGLAKTFGFGQKGGQKRYARFGMRGDMHDLLLDELTVEQAVDRFVEMSRDR